MSDIAISVNSLGKYYHLGVIGRQTLQDELRFWWWRLRGHDPSSKMGTVLEHPSSLQEGEVSDSTGFWALKDVSFEIRAGEVLGIVGSNGAGKSTLLKILSRITEPSEGEAFIHGRIASLLEVGTGFHPELTGRENVYLNGAILGMTKPEIKAKYDSIVEFAEMSRFIETPVKRYSSGMLVRLAFAVAAHLDPEILLIDEVLAVGDAAFQKKCLGKMSEVANEGRTVLFVSHNMSAVTRLCSRAIWLKSGSLVMDDTAESVVHHYLRGTNEIGGHREWSLKEAPGKYGFKLLSVTVCDHSGKSAAVHEIKNEVRIRIRYEVTGSGMQFRCLALLYAEGVLVFAGMEPTERIREKPGVYVSEMTIPGNLLAETEYTVGVSVFTSRGSKQHFVKIDDVLMFQVYDDMKGDSARGDYAQNFSGVVRPKMDWDMVYEGNV
jgi:lipopolysaccharide transport system ATP-binding protein